MERQAGIKKLLEVPRREILLGPTPITTIKDGLRVADIAGLQCSAKLDSLRIKRDDLTPGLGNKTRKLEVLLADVLSRGVDTIITAGGPQSNHCRQTAQFGKEAGLEVHLMFGTATGEQDFPYIGNQVVDRLFGAQIHTCKKRDRPTEMVALAEKLRAEGKNPHVIAVGGSDHLGTLAYARGFFEFLEQDKDLDLGIERIVFASSSGGTHAGLVVGAKLADWRGDILGISIDQVPDIDEEDQELQYVRHMISISNDALKTIGMDMVVTDIDFRLNYNYLQDGYGVVGFFDRLGVRTLANHGIIAGPVYSGRAFGAFLDLVSKGDIPDDGKTLFWHTGGAGEIEIYKEDLFTDGA